jgi:nicotinamidase-related amidase
MTDKIWDRFLTGRDRAVIEAAGYGAPAGLGDRPALLVVDMTYNFCGDRPAPVLESIKRWRASCGEAAWEAIPRVAELAAAARAVGAPVIYTLRADGVRGRSDDKNRRRGEDTASGNRIVAELAPWPQDLLVAKRKPSAFFGTTLLETLARLNRDTLVIAGCTTSGCVRATAVDGFSHDFRVAIPADAVFDRCEASHAIGLFDMDAKYADVTDTSRLAAYFRGLPHDELTTSG